MKIAVCLKRVPDTAATSGSVGVVLPLSGPLARFGQESLEGVLLAAGVFDVSSAGFGPSHGFFPALGICQQSIGSGNDDEVSRSASSDGDLQTLLIDIDGHHLFRPRPSSIVREHLIFDMNGGDASVFELANRARDIRRLAIAGARVRDDGQLPVHASGHGACHGDDFAHGHDPFGNAELQPGSHATDKKVLEPQMP